MEDILSILITVGFVAVAIFSNRKGKPQGRKTSEGDNGGSERESSESREGSMREGSAGSGKYTLPEGWPTIESLPKMKRPAATSIPDMKRPAAPKSASRYSRTMAASPQKMHPDSQEAIVPETSAAAAPGRKLHKSVKEKPRVAPAAAGAETDERRSPLATDFELEKAVVWSEILKPKFQDE